MAVALGCGMAPSQPGAGGAASPPRFELSTSCMACHNGLVTPSGEDISFGPAWRASMMANSARDPYWHAAVRREVIDHPTARAAIEDECSKCHMPMAHVQTRAAGGKQTVFDHVPRAAGPSPAADPFALDGVSCSLCHQISSERLGERASFTGGFVIGGTGAAARPMYGPYEVDRGHLRVMESAVGAQPTTAPHVQRSELCATCHTLYTHALDDAGKVIGELPEQVPYEEWLHSEFRTTRSCQACHMPAVEAPTAIASVLGPPRREVSRHDFRGANFFVLGMLAVYRAELGVVATPLELDAAVTRTRAFLRERAARVTIARVDRAGGRLTAEVVVENLAGHKLPTAYPSRRAWLRVTVQDGGGTVVFASGQLAPTGEITGNDNDRDATRFEPHHAEIRSADEVQIYESILGGPDGEVTTGLLTAVTYLKDNRVLPRGFDKRTAPPEVAVHGAALGDPDFGAGEDRVRYVIDLGDAPGPFTVDAELWYQPIGFRWATNLRDYDAVETRRFVRYYEAQAPGSSALLAGARARAE
ncbi:MAG: cytochrome c family protein [Deltaproteobacteria bacterium]|nr:cytochrome c family protein [Kofleriaceae bacterium]